MEDFIEVHTVRDIALRISTIIASRKGSACSRTQELLPMSDRFGTGIT